MARFLVEIGGSGGIVFALGDRVVKQRVSRVDREVVPARTHAAQDLVDHFLTVDRHLQRHAQIVVVKRGGVAAHDEHIVPGASSAFNRHIGVALKQFDNLGVDPVHQVDLARLNGRRAGGVVVDRQDFDLVSMAARRIPVVGVLFKGGANARLMLDHFVSAAADACRGVVHAATGLDDEVVVGHQEGQVGVASGQGQGDHVALGLHVGDAFDDALCARLRLVIGVALQRCHHVFGRHGCAVVIFNAFADLEHPLGRIRVGRDFLCHAQAQSAIQFHINQRFAPGRVDHEGHVRSGQGRVQRVGAFAALHTCAQQATLDGCVSKGCR